MTCSQNIYNTIHFGTKFEEIIFQNILQLKLLRASSSFAGSFPRVFFPLRFQPALVCTAMFLALTSALVCKMLWHVVCFLFIKSLKISDL